VIKGLKKKGKTIFLTTHYMEEAEVLADYIGIISKGKIIAYGTTTELIDKHFQHVHVTIKGAGANVVAVAKAMELQAKEENGNVVLEAVSNDQIIDFLSQLKAKNVKFDGMDIRKPNLEELFLMLTGEELAAENEEEKK
jgi:ABC-2 type transport system ATP-binding protein